jgi:WD40 repeat protein
MGKKWVYLVLVVLAALVGSLLFSIQQEKAPTQTRPPTSSAPLSTQLANATHTTPQITVQQQYPTQLKLLWITQPLVDKNWLIQNGIYARAWDWSTYEKGIVTASPDGRFIAVGTQKGELYIFASNGTLVAKFTYGLGRVPYYVQDFTPDGKYLVVGIASREGELVIYDTSSWREVASIKLAQYLLGPSNATDATITKQPWHGVRPMFITFSDGLMFVTIGESVIDPVSQQPKYVLVKYNLIKMYPELRKVLNKTEYVVSRYTSVQASRLLAVKIGSWDVVWYWPKEGPAYTSLPIATASGGYVAVATWWYIDPRDPYKWFSGVVYVLNATNGNLLYKFAPPPLVPYFNYTSIWNGLALSPDAKNLVVVTDQGTIYALDNKRSAELGMPVVLWSASIMTPIPAQALVIPQKGRNHTLITSYVYTFSGLAGVTQGRLVAYTSSTYVTYWAPGAERRPLIQHPNQTKIFVLNLTNGQLLYVDKFMGKPVYGKVIPFAIAGCFVYVPIGQDWVAADASMSGVYVFDVCRYRAVARFITIPQFGVPLDLDVRGDKIYVLVGLINTAPSEFAPANIIGEYQLLAFKAE